MAKTRRRRRRGVLLVVGMLSALALMAVLAGLWAARRVALPAPREEIAESWARVEQWAEPGSGLGPAGALLQAQRSIPDGQRFEPSLAGESAPPRMVLADLPPGIRAAVGQLESWARGEGGIPRCGDGLDELRMLDLGRWALATAAPDDVPRVRAVLRLASALRNAGTQLQAAIGVLLTEDALHWGHDRGVDPRSYAAMAAPRPGEAFDVIARDIVCLLEVGRFEATPRDGLPVAAPMEREIAWVHWYYGDLLSRAHPHRADTPALHAFLTAESERFEDEPPPADLIRAIAVLPRTRVWLELEDTWDELFRPPPR